MDIKRVPNQPKFCLEFSRKSGSAIVFYDNANKFIDLLELVNNTTLDPNDTGAIVEPIQQAAAAQ